MAEMLVEGTTMNSSATTNLCQERRRSAIVYILFYSSLIDMAKNGTGKTTAT